MPELTPRQNQLLLLVMAGKQNREIAAAMGITENTVKFHLKSMNKRLGVRNRAALVASMAPVPLSAERLAVVLKPYETLLTGKHGVGLTAVLRLGTAEDMAAAIVKALDSPR